jgi:molybdate transport system regulatory protein
MTVIKIRIEFDDDRYIGHGRIQLLELIGEHGSITRAARAMGMSYKRAWHLISEFGAMFSDPLIECHHRGSGVTPFGAELVRQYREMEAKAMVIFAKPLSSMEKHLASSPKSARR